MPPTRATELLIGWRNGNREALDELLPLVYDELRRIARYYLSQERPAHTLQPTALVHEAYLRLVDQKQVDWKNRAQFFGLATEMMRRILVNYARDRRAGKRGQDAERISLSLAEFSSGQPDIEMMALDQALTKLSTFDPRKGRIIELKFFGGLTTEEIAEVVELSTATVEREWVLARAWLFREISGNE
jgi:RNA polymerase sigma factor (TIGR02999 family)